MEICCIAFLIAVKNFKRSCCVSGITDTYKASIEECITGLKSSLRDEHGGDDEVLIVRNSICKIFALFKWETDLEIYEN